MGLKTFRQPTIVPLGKVSNFNVKISWLFQTKHRSVAIKKSVVGYSLQLQLNTALEISGDIS